MSSDNARVDSQQASGAAGRENDRVEPDTVSLPAPTAWPIVLAFGLSLATMSLVTSWAFAVVGLTVAIVGACGWFLDVLPHEQHEEVPILEAEPAVVTARPLVARIDLPIDLPRAALPLETYPVSAGVLGGAAGAVVMAILAIVYGVVVRGSVWYPINLLALSFVPASEATADIVSFHPVVFAIACVIHVLTSLMVGLLYGAVLPMIPRRPVLLGGLVAPLAWCVLIYGTLGIINPLMNQRIDWPWFVASQIGFGLVAGMVVARQHRLPTWDRLPFSIRAGIHAPGVKE